MFYFQILFSNTTQVELLTNSFNDPILKKKKYQERSRKLRAEQVFNQITLEERFSSRTFCFRVLHNQVFPTGSIKSECNGPDLLLHVLTWMGFTRANVVIFSQSVLYWKVSVLRTETAKIVTHLSGFLQTEKVIFFPLHLSTSKEMLFGKISETKMKSIYINLKIL